MFADECPCRYGHESPSRDERGEFCDGRAERAVAVDGQNDGWGAFAADLPQAFQGYGRHVPSVNRHGEYGDGFARQRGGVPGGMGQVDGRDCRYPVHACRFVPVSGGRLRCRRCGSRFRGLPGRGFRCRVVSGGHPCGSPFRPCHPLRHSCGDFPRCPGRREKEGVNACRFHVPGRFFFDVKIAFFRLNFYICHETCKIEKR